MSEHVVNDIIRTPFYTGTAGETFTVNRAKYGTATDFASLISFSDLGGGDYDLVFTPVVADPNYRARWTSSVTQTLFVDEWSVDVFDGMTQARAAKLDSLGAASVTVQSPVVAGGAVTIVAGNAYLAADGSALTFTLPGIASSLNGRPATLTVLDGFGAAIMTKTATISIASGTGLISFDLTSTDTNLTPLPYRHKITATFLDGGPVTLAAAAFVIS